MYLESMLVLETDLNPSSSVLENPDKHSSLLIVSVMICIYVYQFNHRLTLVSDMPPPQILVKSCCIEQTAFS